jgi:hypothetical protein
MIRFFYGGRPETVPMISLDCQDILQESRDISCLIMNAVLGACGYFDSGAGDLEAERPRPCWNVVPNDITAVLVGRESSNDLIIFPQYEQNEKRATEASLLH